MTRPQETHFSPGDFRLEVDGHREIKVTGELDLASAPRLKDAYQIVADRGEGPLLIDLTGVTFIDSSGIHALVSAYEAYSEQLTIITSKPVTRMLELCGLRTRLPVIEA